MSRVLFLKIAALLLAISFLVYGNTLFNKFVWDDTALIVNSPYVKDIKYLKAIFLGDVGMLSAYREPMGFYRPLSLLSFTFDYKIWRLQPFGYHLHNIIIHSINSILVFLLFFYLTKQINLSLLSALIFVLHPVHNEVVAAVFNRMEMLACLFVLLSFLFYITITRKNRIKNLSMSVAFFTLGILSKETGIILILILMLYDYYFVVEYKMKLFVKRLFYYLPYCVIILLYLLTRSVINIQDKNSLYILSLISVPESLFLKILTLFKITAFYIKLLFFPFNLSALYLFNISKLDFSSIFSVFLVFALIISALILRKRNKLLSFFIAFLILTISFFSFLVSRLQERFLYLPSIGFCFILGHIFIKAFSRTKEVGKIIVGSKSFVMLILICLLLLYSFKTFIRNYDWRTELMFWEATASSCEKCNIAHVNLGYLYKDLVEYDKAQAEFQKAISLSPKDFRAYQGMGNVLLFNGDIEQNSLSYLNKALNLMPVSPSIYNDIGVYFAMKGNFEASLLCFEKAINLWQDYPEAHYNIGMLYYNRKDLEKAMLYFQRASELNPDKPKFKQYLDEIEQEFYKRK